MEAFEKVENKWQNMAKYGRHVFGAGAWMGTRADVKIHKGENSYLVTSYGDPVIEVFPDHVILLAPEQKIHQYAYSWRSIVAYLIGRNTANRISRRKDPRLGLSIAKYQDARFLSYCVLNSKLEATNTDFASLKEFRDEEKVKVFNKKLHPIFKPIEVAVRLGGLKDQIIEATEENTHISEAEMVRRINENEVVSTAAVLRFVVQSRYKQYFLRSSENVLRSLKTAKTNIRLTFLHSCTMLEFTPYVPEASYVSYQNVVLQSVNGLRTVPVQGEVKIHRPRARATKATPVGEDGTRERTWVQST